MQVRKLGRSGVQIPPLMLGGNVFGMNVDQAGTNAILDAFVDLGGAAIDTADVYSAWMPNNQGGESETLIGSWIKSSGKRDRIVLATKVGMWPAQPGLRASNIEAAIEGSLKRLQTDYVDIYFAHRDDAETPVSETLSAFDKLVKAGKVRTLGASNFSAARLKESLDWSAANGVARYEVFQPEYNLMKRDIEADVLPLCAASEVGVVSYFALASGFLSGKYRSAADKSKSVRGARMDAYLNEKGFRVLDALDAVAARRNSKPAQVAIAWVMAKPGITAPIASATNVAQLHELMGALRLTLSAEDVAALDGASA